MKACNSCGKCCIKYSNGDLSASDSDLKLWEKFRPEINRYVRNKKIWIDPTTGKQIELCPWLRKEPNASQYTCAIYYDRPEDCRIYPNNVDEMLRDGCEMLEKNDLLNMKSAQIELNCNFRDD